MKKALCIIISIIMITLSGSTAIFAESLNDNLSVVRSNGMTKAEFATYCDRLYAQTVQTSQKRETTESEIESLLKEYNRTKSIEVEAKLNQAGVFVYSSSSSAQNTRTSDNGHVFISDVSITYSSQKQEWTVSAGGYWTDLSGIADESGTWVGFYEGATRNIGGLDAFGIAFYNTSGTVPTMKSCYAEIGDGTGNFDQYSSNAIMDSSTGAAFLYQDHLICTRVTGWFSYDWAYFGQMFDITMKFDSSFSAFNGKARAFIYHTWEDTSITSIGVNVGSDSFGINVGWENEGNSWPAFSSGETPF